MTLSLRRAFTLVELLVVLALSALLLGIILGAVQAARATAARAACANNLRQIGLATQTYHDAHHQFPSGCRFARDEPKPFMSWLVRIAPQLEQQALWDEAMTAFAADPNFARGPHTGLARELLVLLCPAESRRSGTTIEGTTAAFTHYLGVTGTPGGFNNGILYLNSKVTIADIRDGLSNTLLLGERPPSPDNHFGWWYAGVGQELDGSADFVMAVLERNRTFRAPTCPRQAYPFGPGNPDNMCDTFHFWSRHSGGANFAFADGSVRFISYSADSILPALATRAGGDSVPGDW
jgi:prepilin-type processing-associated H-X9-DG protein/prepilin-type N-terminal cleavage/methylation domain-containing protein